ncbi:DUF5131 family protein [Thalassospira tepidiphila]|uniref:Phage protein Gp37/Gp68 n=2 Tax=Thalassospira tepidiphila TaxID=393657 RepID=A0A853KV84_9PROT|nr:phage Gp37/Gp68 family protein [Thalassospira tepidiphila]NJB74580.1 protein gp37 [Thalassospira tepidiphila]OAZ08084.1 hypothetical protein TH4_18735 [Thalassospira tepidiphila MCCC 1A03514]
MTKIEWTQREGTKGKTWNPLRARNKKTGGVGHFCEKVSPGCKNCYAETFQKRFKNPVRYAAQDADQVEVFLDQKTLVQPIGWKKPATIFVCSQTDLFLHHYKSEWIDQVFAVMALCPQHTFIILTKRHDRMNAYFGNLSDLSSRHSEQTNTAFNCADLLNLRHLTKNPRGKPLPSRVWPLPNVWLGVSVEDQKAADERIPVLLDTPAAVRFLSVEPLLGPVDLANHNAPGMCGTTDHADYLRGYVSPEYSCRAHLSKETTSLDWVIVGGESGHNARPMHPDWARSLRDQCKAAGVPFFFKQWGAWAPVEEYPSGKQSMNKVGKKRAGRSLDGVEHNEWPEVKS